MIGVFSAPRRLGCWLVNRLADVLLGKAEEPYVSETSCRCNGTGIFLSHGGFWRACTCPAADRQRGGSDPS